MKKIRTVKAKRWTGEAWALFSRKHGYVYMGPGRIAPQLYAGKYDGGTLGTLRMLPVRVTITPVKKHRMGS